MSLEKCPTCGRPMYVKRAVGPEVVHLLAMLLLLAALWLIVKHSALVVHVVRGLL